MSVCLTGACCSLPCVQCLPCPAGAYCDGGLTPPRALAGWFDLNGTGPTQCPPERLSRPYCDYFVPCEPPEACLGNNTCAEGYVSVDPIYRCAACDPCYRGPTGTGSCNTYYRRGGECLKCPSLAWMLILMFAVVAIGACLGTCATRGCAGSTGLLRDSLSHGCVMFEQRATSCRGSRCTWRSCPSVWTTSRYCEHACVDDAYRAGVA